MAQSAVSFFSLDNPRLSRTLKARLQEEIDRQAVLIISGNAPDYASYKERIGELRGLRQAIHICDELEKDLAKEN